MEEYNFIGDIAGELSALKRLHARMPNKAKTWGVGDLVDRGPDSKGVIEWFMSDPANRDSLMGNHEDMLIDYYQGAGKYPRDCWIANGGRRTMDSYGIKFDPLTETVPLARKFRDSFHVEHLEWLKSRPLYFKTDGLLVTHAPVHGNLSNCLENDYQYEDGKWVLWSRRVPTQKPEFQIFGHNSMWGLSWFCGKGPMAKYAKFAGKPPKNTWAVCIDGSRSKVLTGIHWPSLEVFQEPYGDPLFT